MRRALFRFTIRRCMALVAIVATLLASGIAGKRWLHLHAVYQERAKYHAQKENDALEILSVMAQMIDAYTEAEAKVKDTEVECNRMAGLETERKPEDLMKSDPEFRRAGFDILQQQRLLKETMIPLEEVAKAARGEIDYHSRLKKKYERAAALPWT